MDPTAIRRDQAREIDRLAMEDLGIPGILLMENAAIGIAAVACGMRPHSGPVAVLCGPGNNGGDGFAAARHLYNAGIDVRCHLLVPPEAYAPGSDAGVNLQIARRIGISLRRDLGFAGARLLLDAIFGTGLQREVGPPYRAAIEAMNASGIPILAVDLPSGLDADSGEELGLAVRATATATMVAPKCGFYTGIGPVCVGRIHVVGIGIPPSLVERVRAGS